jgi:hypothetical protein
MDPVTNKARIGYGQVSIETEASAVAVRSVIKQLKRLGFETGQLSIRSPKGFECKQEMEFAMELPLVAVHTVPDFLEVMVGFRREHVRPVSPRIVVVCRHT